MPEGMPDRMPDKISDKMSDRFASNKIYKIHGGEHTK
jgi:S-adenosylmethionine synthetase